MLTVVTDFVAQDVSVLLSFYKLVSYKTYQIIKLYPKQSELSLLQFHYFFLPLGSESKQLFMERKL